METTDTSRSKTSESGSDGEASRATPSDGAKGTRRKLNDQQEREVTRLYAETETPVSEISKRFGIGESSVYRVAQRHGAALRGRTATSSEGPRPARATAAAAPGATTGRGTRGRRRAANTSAASTAAKTTGAASRPAGTPSTNGRRTPGPRGRAAATPARRTSATATRATRAPRGSRAAVVAATRRQFRVSYTAVRVFVAASMADAIRQAEAAGATDITGIERSS
jgi:transposase-like protein